MNRIKADVVKKNDVLLHCLTRTLLIFEKQQFTMKLTFFNSTTSLWISLVITSSSVVVSFFFLATTTNSRCQPSLKEKIIMC